MEKFLDFRPDLRKSIGSGAKTDINLCWTCGACDAECPVNLATGRLRPQAIVRMANLGLLEELIEPARDLVLPDLSEMCERMSECRKAIGRYRICPDGNDLPGAGHLELLPTILEIVCMFSTRSLAGG